ncbi:Kinetochore protein Sos7 [Coniochaeta hoffmannii]|uniref:Kinetochore protein Sos7 n=1 Tax=Coniochaeta hoffmannii TaxID=91930 RepID=A0AA38RY90_9PEZI|nr:Kinetochore protein Sos7 [Coniochaeta hoffmannii]
MSAPDASRILAGLEALQGREITILKLSEDVASALPDTTSTTTRTSDVSNSALETSSNNTPAALEADLAHYRELFSKLRFSYVEQVTKEKFIRAIIADPPEIVTPAENLALERDNAVAKARLKALKTDVAATVERLEEQGRELARRWEGVSVRTARLRDLPERIEGLEESIAALREAGHGDAAAGREMNLPLERTLELVVEKRRRAAGLDKMIESLGAAVPRKRKEAERLGAELTALEAKRTNSTTAAREARKRKEARLGGAEDDLEQRGRWWRAEEAVLKRMLQA